MKIKVLAGLFAPLVALGLSLAAGTVHAGTKYQTTLVPDVEGATPGFSAKGSSIKIDGKRLALKGKVKKVVNGAGMRISTDPDLADDDYSVEVDLAVAATATSGTVAVKFDLNNGNGKFKVDLAGDPVFAGASPGDGVAVTAVRVKDGSGTVIGSGGFALSQ